MATPKKKRERKPTKERAKKKPLTLLVHIKTLKADNFFFEKVKNLSKKRQFKLF